MHHQNGSQKKTLTHQFFLGMFTKAMTKKYAGAQSLDLIALTASRNNKPCRLLLCAASVRCYDIKFNVHP